MRGIYLFTFALCGVILTAPFTPAQDAAKPIAIKVLIEADGSIKLIDANTGKEVSDAKIIKAKVKLGQPPAQADGNDPDDVRKLVEKILREKGLKIEGQEKRIEIQLEKKGDDKAKAITIIIGPDGKVQVNPDARIEDAKKRAEEAQRKAEEAREKALRALQYLKEKQATPPPADAKGDLGVEKKLDLILKQLEELRKDVNSIKNRLDAIQPERKPKALLPSPDRPKDKKPGAIEIELFPGRGKDTKPDKEVRKEVDQEDVQKLIEKLLRDPITPAKRKADGLPPVEVEQIFPNLSVEDLRKYLENSLPKASPAATPADIERRIEQLQQQREELQRELRRAKPASK